jgi:hypothetical protein
MTKKKVKYFFDTEFIEDGKTIDLLSIGIVCEDGRELYMKNAEADLDKASPWVRVNVLPHLAYQVGYSKDVIRDQVKSFVSATPDLKPEFWAYYADYDWVVLCQLFGTMMELPEHWPMYCHDLKQYVDDHNVGILPEKPSIEHNAICDARWVKSSYEHAVGVRKARTFSVIQDWIREDTSTGMKMLMRREEMTKLLSRLTCT